MSISYIPANPTYGDLVRVTVQLCEQTYGDPRLAVAISTQATKQTAGAGGQIFVVDANGVDRKDVTFTNGGTDLGMHLGSTRRRRQPGSARTAAARTDGRSRLLTTCIYPQRIIFPGFAIPPAFIYWSGMQDYSFNVGNWSSLAACVERGYFFRARYQ